MSDTIQQTGQKKGLFARSSAAAVAAGILLSRLIGLIRERVFAHYFGNSMAADAFRAAFRIPNMLQNLFGEGVLSASFIPVYARLRAQEEHETASELAEAVFSVLFLVTSLLMLLGVLATPFLISLIAPGFTGDKRELTIHLVRILFPGAALLVLSAWCLGILNSHRRFFLSYAAPVAWNLTIIAAYFLPGGHQQQEQLAIRIAWASVAGSALQFLVQLPAVLQHLWPLHIHLSHANEHLRTVLKNFAPVFVSRGVVQISAYLDSLLASYLPEGAVSAFGYAQILNSLPVSLFGMAISAAELPAMSSALGTDDEIATQLRARLQNGLRNISYFVIPSAVAFVLLGDTIVGTIYRGGHFGADDVNFVWSVLAGSGVGLLASTSGRLYSSAFYALRNTRTPLNFALVRVALTVALGYLCSKPLPHLLGINPRWGVAGLTLSAGIAGWVEFTLLRRALTQRIGHVPPDAARSLKLWLCAIAAAAIGFAAKRTLPLHAAWPLYPVVLVLFAAAYLLLTLAARITPPGAIGRALPARLRR